MKEIKTMKVINIDAKGKEFDPSKVTLPEELETKCLVIMLGEEVPA